MEAAGIPDELRGWPNWVVWRKEWRCGRPIKMPLNARTGGWASTQDLETWSTLDDALASSVRADGLGFVLTGTPFVGLDVDCCLDGGRLEQRAMAVVKRFGTYAERSPSGTGLHLIGRGKAVFHDGGSQWGRRQAGLMGFSSFECYNSARYLTMTGRVLDDYKHVVDVQDVLDAMTAALWPAQQQESTAGEQQERAAVGQEPGTRKGRELADDFIVQKASSGRRGEWFHSLYEKGELAPYGGDHSRADLALLGWLAFWTNGNAQQMERLFSASALGQRKKWRERQAYREMTIQAALSHWNGVGYVKG